MEKSAHIALHKFRNGIHHAYYTCGDSHPKTKRKCTSPSNFISHIRPETAIRWTDGENAMCPLCVEWPLAYIAPLEIDPKHDVDPRGDPNATLSEEESGKTTEKALPKTE